MDSNEARARSLIVSFSMSGDNEESSLLLVGRKKDVGSVFDSVDVVNVIQGKRALDIWKELSGDDGR